MKRKPFVFPASLMIATMMLASGVAITDAHADNLISSAQARDGTLVTASNDISYDWDLSNRIVENGLYVDHSFAYTKAEEFADPSFSISIKIGLKKGLTYYLETDEMGSSAMLLDSNNINSSNMFQKFFQLNTNSLVDRSYFSVNEDGVYTLRFSGFPNGFDGRNKLDGIPAVKLYQAVHNGDKVHIDFHGATSGYDKGGYKYVIQEPGDNIVNVRTKGVSTDPSEKDVSDVFDLTYQTLYDDGTWLSSRYMTNGTVIQTLDGKTYDTGSYIHITIPASEIMQYVMSYDSPLNGHGYVDSEIQTGRSYNKAERKDQAQHLNFWESLKSFIGDPVDTYTGAFTDSRTLLSYAGNNPLHFDMNYDSVANDSWSVPGGYTTNFEKKLVIFGEDAHVYLSPNTVIDYEYQSQYNFYKSVDRRNDEAATLEKLDDGTYRVSIVGKGTYLFDSTGKITSETDAVGQVTQYSYDSDNLLTKVSNNRGQSFSFAYDNKRLISVTDGTGRKLTFTYSDSNELTSVENMYSGTHFDISYDASGYINSLKYGGKTLVANEYDEFGRVLSQVDVNHVTSTYSYTSSADQSESILTKLTNGNHTIFVSSKYGDLLRKTDAANHTTSYSYNDMHQRISETDPNGNTFKYGYSEYNELNKISTPLNRLYHIDHDQGALVNASWDTFNPQLDTMLTDKNQWSESLTANLLDTFYDYDAFGNPTTITKKYATSTLSTIKYAYDDNGYLISLSDNGKVTYFENDSLGRVLKETLPDGKIIEYTYDSNNNVLSAGSDGHMTYFTYDELGNLIKKVAPNKHVTTYTYNDNNQLASVTDNSSQTQIYHYDSDARITSITIGSDTVAKYTYDDVGNKLSSTDYNGNVTTYRYDSNDQLISSTVGGATTTYSYDQDGQVVSMTTGNNNKVQYGYDGLGNLIKQTLADGTVVENTYDEMGHISTSTSNGKTTSYDYDRLGNRTSITDADGNKTSYGYNLDGQVTSSTNALGHVTKYVYNDNGQLSQMLNNRGEVTAKYAYDDTGNVVSVSNSQNVVRTMTYDANNNLLTVKDANGDLVSKNELNSDEQIISTINALNSKSSVAYRYDNSQETVTTTNQLGHKQSTTIDYGGNVIKASDDVTSGTASYDANSNLASQSVNNGQNKTSLTYDKDQNVVSEANNDGKETYSYDALDQLSSWTNARGNTTTYTRDADGNITEAKASDIDNQYTYDSNGNETGAKNSNSEITKTYDALNRVVSKTQDGQTVKYTYDDREFLTDITYPGDKKVHYDINTDGQITSITDWNNHKTNYSYDKNGRVVTTTNWNGIVESRTYNTAGQVLTIKTSLHDKTLTDYKYTYDADGNLVTDNSQTYTYDMLDRLTAGQDKYTYDAIGNITAVGSHKMAYDDDSRLTSIDGDKTTVDKDGNLTSYTMSGKAHTASYNSQNQLTKYDDLSYTYDADSNRVSAGSDRFVYDDNGHLLNDGTNTYVYGASGVVGYYNKDNKFITYLFNQRGDVVKETDESGSVANSFDYNDYGKLTSSDHVAGSMFGYGGQYGAVTDKNGLVFLRTRYYNPEIMRFMNRDTVRGSITDTKSLNRFAYVEGNPLTYVDPNGEAATWLKSNWVGLLQGAVVTGISYLFPPVGFALSLLSIGQDLSTGNYAGVLLDSFSIFAPVLKNARTISTSEKVADQVIENRHVAKYIQAEKEVTGVEPVLTPKYVNVSSNMTVAGGKKEVVDLSRTVYQRNDIDPTFVHPSARGRSNLELMQRGNAPYGKDGKRIELHHAGQEEPGDMIEALKTVHNKKTAFLHENMSDSWRHDLGPQGQKLDNEFKNFRPNYWKNRANDFNEGLR